MLSRRHSASAAEREIRLAVTGSLPGCLANREANLTLLILENLLNNAIQATPRGKCVELSAQPDDGQVIFRVSDEGAGLPSHVRERLFSPVRSTKEGGSGIGLTICRQLALHIGASLDLESSTVNGTVFRVRVPLLQAVSSSPEPARIPTAG